MFRYSRPALVAGSALAALALSAPAALAEGFPRSGEASFDTYWVAKIVASAETPIGKGVLSESTGVTRNLKGEAPFNNLTDVCLGQNTVLGEEWSRGFGTCVKTDKDGDKMLATYEVGKPWLIVGGSGKYKGMTGTGTDTYEYLQETATGWTAIGHHTIKWEFKQNPS